MIWFLLFLVLVAGSFVSHGYPGYALLVIVLTILLAIASVNGGNKYLD